MTTNPQELPTGDVQMPGRDQSQSTDQHLSFKAEGGSFAGASNTANTVQLEEANMEAGLSEIELVVDEEEAKPKPILQLKYQGFHIFGNCLCIVVEPWPPIRAVSRAPSIAPIFSNAARAASMAPPNVVTSGPLEATHRELTPLFLPDLDRGRSETPAPFIRGRVLPPAPLFNNSMDQENGDSNDYDLMEFSQALNYASDHRGGPDDDDEIDGAVFFGDADETREF